MESGFDPAMKYRLYEDLISPLLTKEPKGSILYIFFNLAERGFVDGIRKVDLSLAQEYAKVCKIILKEESLKEDFKKIISLISSEIEFDSVYRVNHVIRNTSDSDDVHTQLQLYTSLTENFIRPLLTPVYFFLSEFYGKKVGAKTPDEFVNTSIGQKNSLISPTRVTIQDIDVTRFTEDLDLVIRHGGTAHEHWMELDGDIIEIKNYSPSTGRQKDRVELTKGELKEKIKNLKRLVWSLMTGFYVLLNNSEVKIEKSKPRTKEALESFSSSFSKESRLLELEKPFKWNEDSLEVNMTHIPVDADSIHPGGQIFTGEGSWDVIYLIDDIKLKYQVLDVIKYITFLLDLDKYKKIKARVMYEDEVVGDMTYNLEDFLKIDQSDTYIPEAESGKEIDENLTIKMVTKLTAPVGTKKLFIKMLESKYPDAKII